MRQSQSYLRQRYGHLGERTNCLICGKVYQFLGRHIIKHDITAVEYKDKFCILRKTPLCADDYVIMKRKEIVDRINSGILKPPMDALPKNHWKPRFEFPLAFRQEMSRFNKGKVLSVSHKAKIGKAHKGLPDPKRSNEFKEHLKVLAKNRTRIQGRFVKVQELNGNTRYNWAS